MNYLLLVIGFTMLVKGADLFVEGSASIAKRLKIPSMLIGLTIVAFGTSAPEAAVSINASLKNSSELAAGNIVGSNIFNLLVVIGIAAMIKPINIDVKTLAKEFPFMILATAVLYILGNDIVLGNASANILTRADGLILLAVFGVLIYHLVEMAMSPDEDSQGSNDIIMAKTIPVSIVIGIVGLAGILFGSELVVRSSTSIALQFGMSETLVGLTIVAIGTSLPELVTSVVAARKGESDIALGNVIGSNLFNILFVLGISSTISPIVIQTKILTDIIFLFGITLLTYWFGIVKKKITKPEGIILLLLYIAYTFFIIIRN